MACPSQVHTQLTGLPHRGHAGKVTETHQYAVSEYSTPMATRGRGIAAVDIMYDMSPIVVTINESPASFLHFLVRLCAVVGGAFAVTGGCHSVLTHQASQALHP